MPSLLGSGDPQQPSGPLLGGSLYPDLMSWDSYSLSPMKLCTSL